MISNPDSMEILCQFTNCVFIIDDSVFDSLMISLIFLSASITIIPTPKGMVTPKDRKITPMIK